MQFTTSVILLLGMVAYASCPKPSKKVNEKVETEEKMIVEAKETINDKKHFGKQKIKDSKSETKKDRQTIPSAENGRPEKVDLTETLLQVKGLITDVKDRVEKLETTNKESQFANQEKLKEDPLAVAPGDSPQAIMDKKMMKKLKKQQEKLAKADAKEQRKSSVQAQQKIAVQNLQFQSFIEAQPNLTGIPPLCKQTANEQVKTQDQVDAKLEAKRVKKYPWLTLEQFQELENGKESKKKLEKLLKVVDSEKLRMLVREQDESNGRIIYNLVPTSPVELLTGSTADVDLESPYIVFTDKSGLQVSDSIQINIQSCLDSSQSANSGCESRDNSDVMLNQPTDGKHGSLSFESGIGRSGVLNRIRSYVDEAEQLNEEIAGSDTL